MAIQIINIRRGFTYSENPHAAITDFKWKNLQTGAISQSTKIAMIDWIANKGGVAYVFGRNGSKVLCHVMRGKYSSWVQTYADSTPTDNLLNLPTF